jgi:hypothetical protein
MEYAMGESGCTGVDVYGSAAGEVENTPFVGPAVRAPRPSRYRIVDKGSPEKDEDEEVAGSVFPRRSPADKRRTIERRRVNACYVRMLYTNDLTHVKDANIPWKSA